MRANETRSAGEEKPHEWKIESIGQAVQPTSLAILLVARLEKPDFKVSGNFEMSGQTPAKIYDGIREFDAALLQIRHRLMNVIAVEGNVMGARRHAVRDTGFVAAH